MPATRTHTKRAPRPGAATPPDAAPAPGATPPAASPWPPGEAPRSEAALYAPDPAAITIDGRRFRLGRMRIGPSLRFTGLASRLIARSTEATRAAMTIEDPVARQGALAGFNWLAILPEEDAAELIAIALSNDEAIDRAWVAEHWDLAWVLEVLAAFTTHNDVAAYFRPLGTLLVNLTQTMTALQATMIPTG